MRATALVLIVSFLTLGAGDVFAQQNEAPAWRQVAEAIPLGSKVKIQTLDNERLSGTLMRVDATSVMVKRHARRPEATRTIAIDEIARIERDTGGGVDVGKSIAIGVATGAGAILSLFVIALQLN